MKIVAFDLETTGLKWEEGHRVMEFTFVELDGDLNPGRPWSQLVNPSRAIPEEIQEITNITQAMVDDKPTFETFAPGIQELVQDATLVAHNHRFDVPFLHNELIKAGQPGLKPNHPAIDTMIIERKVNSHSLAACFERYTGQEMDGAHRSQADTLAMIDVLRAQREQHAAKLPDTVEGLTTTGIFQHFNPESSQRIWLDHGHKFYEDDGKVYFGFGKFRDQVIDKSNSDHNSYLLWMKERDFPDDTKAVVARLLEPGLQSGQRTL